MLRGPPAKIPYLFCIFYYRFVWFLFSSVESTRSCPNIMNSDQSSAQRRDPGSDEIYISIKILIMNQLTTAVILDMIKVKDVILV